MTYNYTGQDQERFSCRTALEALRNGVPNKEAVKILGSNQAHAEAEFQALLDDTADSIASPENTRSMLLSGDFGTGKSHMLEYFEHLALSRNYVCSRIVVSKQTPFYNLDKVFKAAIDNGVVPGLVGQMVEELGVTLKPDSKEYVKFFQWANSEDSGLHTIFPATLMAHERSQDLDVLSKIYWFWSGDRIKVSDVNDPLRAVGQLSNYRFRAPRARDLRPQRLRFVLELIKAAGYKGWVVLIDELELLGSYSILQRARSYAELSRWMGLTPDEQYPGLVVACTISEDFEQAIINEKEDRDKVEPRLRMKGDDHSAARAVAGMQRISKRTQLAELSDETVQDTIDKIREMYSAAYDWEAPFFESPPGGATYQRRMRYKVKSAVNTWDLQRLYPDSHPEMEGTEYRNLYTEDQDLEAEVKDDDPNS